MIHEELLQVADTELTELDINANLQFRRQALRVEKQLAEINLITQELQLENLSISKYKIAIESLLKCVKNGREEINNPFIQANFKVYSYLIIESYPRMKISSQE